MKHVRAVHVHTVRRKQVTFSKYVLKKEIEIGRRQINQIAFAEIFTKQVCLKRNIICEIDHFPLI